MLRSGPPLNACQLHILVPIVEIADDDDVFSRLRPGPGRDRALVSLGECRKIGQRTYHSNVMNLLQGSKIDIVNLFNNDYAHEVPLKAEIGMEQP
jgi:hypothetical protein